MSRRADAVLLCEDIRQRTFFQRLLRERGYGPRKVRLAPLPQGAGSGEQHVRLHYAAEVRAVRAKATHCLCCLVVAVDADNQTVDHRYARLDEALGESGLQRRHAQDPVAVFVPKWHIETWIDYLLGVGSVSEDQPSQHHLSGDERDCRPAVTRLLALASQQSPLPADCPDSLSRSLGEVPRIPESSG